MKKVLLILFATFFLLINCALEHSPSSSSNGENSNNSKGNSENNTINSNKNSNENINNNVTQLKITTENLPDGKVKVPYETELASQGGKEPYSWFEITGKLPLGLTIESNGKIAGTPEEAGIFDLSFLVEDSNEANSKIDLTMYIEAQDIEITTEELPEAQETIEYSEKIEAEGGIEPYAWMITGGELPEGLQLSSDGEINGTPVLKGDYTFKIKVLDNAENPNHTEKELSLSVKTAPLRIVGDREYEIYTFKVIILSRIVVSEESPVPYEEQLKATGGMEPYLWEETENTTSYLPEYGIPTGLTLSEEGIVSGTVTNEEQIATYTYQGITFSGFFFMGLVTDSQSPAENQRALFLIPTIPITLPTQ